jgi:hypothetical protein
MTVFSNLCSLVLYSNFRQNEAKFPSSPTATLIVALYLAASHCLSLVLANSLCADAVYFSPLTSRISDPPILDTTFEFGLCLITSDLSEASGLDLTACEGTSSFNKS